MTSLPKNPKPHYEKKSERTTFVQVAGGINVKKVISELSRIIDENKKLEEAYKRTEVAL
jgi:hypothetical protein